MGKKIAHMLLGQQALPFRGKNESVWQAGYPLERRIIVVLSFLVVLISVLYIYSVITSVMNVAARQEYALEASTLSAEVATLEAQYLARTEAVTESYAREHGYVSLSHRTFVDKVTSFSLNTDSVR